MTSSSDVAGYQLFEHPATSVCHEDFKPRIPKDFVVLNL